MIKIFKKKNKNTYIIAEAGVNHNGSLKLAKKLIEVAKNCGADCVKFQLFKSENLVQNSTPLASYQKKNIKMKINQNQMLKNLEMSEKNIKKLYQFANKKKIDFLCTPYNLEDLNYLKRIKVKAIKLSSMHATELFFIKEALKLNRPVLLPTGMCNLADINNIKKILRNSKNKKVCIMQCTTNYPTDILDANINVLKSYSKIFNKFILGFSDHTKGSIAACASVSLGAKIIEKHFTLSNKLKGPDHIASLNPKNFKLFVKNIRETEISLGNEKKKITKYELLNKKIVKRSLVAKKQIKAGEKVSKNNVSFKRPLNGIPSSQFEKFLGKKFRINIKPNTLIRKKYLVQ